MMIRRFEGPRSSASGVVTAVSLYAARASASVSGSGQDSGSGLGSHRGGGGNRRGEHRRRGRPFGRAQRDLPAAGRGGGLRGGRGGGRRRERARSGGRASPGHPSARS